ncbi:hypothetical protein [Neisseria sp. S1]|uniref:hypothetical protein n=1 Tax=Neisseria sp. S1 TaxID=3318354 RepID=UPI003A8C4303
MKIEIVKKNLVVYDRTESLVTSILRDLMTLSMLALCVYVSQGSTWWTFLSGMIFIVCVFTQTLAAFQRNSTKFKTWAEFKAWVDAQAEEETKSAKAQIICGNGNVQAGGDIVGQGARK